MVSDRDGDGRRVATEGERGRQNSRGKDERSAANPHAGSDAAVLAAAVAALASGLRDNCVSFTGTGVASLGATLDSTETSEQVSKYVYRGECARERGVGCLAPPNRAAIHRRGWRARRTGRRALAEPLPAMGPDDPLPLRCRDPDDR